MTGALLIQNKQKKIVTIVALLRSAYVKGNSTVAKRVFIYNPENNLSAFYLHRSNFALPDTID